MISHRDASLSTDFDLHGEVVPMERPLHRVGMASDW
jgi:hypothetical protein